MRACLGLNQQTFPHPGIRINSQYFENDKYEEIRHGSRGENYPLNSMAELAVLGSIEYLREEICGIFVLRYLCRKIAKILEGQGIIIE